MINAFLVDLRIALITHHQNPAACKQRPPIPTLCQLHPLKGQHALAYLPSPRDPLRAQQKESSQIWNDLPAIDNPIPKQSSIPKQRWQV